MAGWNRILVEGTWTENARGVNMTMSISVPTANPASPEWVWLNDQDVRYTLYSIDIYWGINIPFSLFTLSPQGFSDTIERPIRTVPSRTSPRSLRAR